MEFNACACMGPIGNDPHCPCLMRSKGLTPTTIWTPEAKAELKEALATIFDLENATANALVKARQD